MTHFDHLVKRSRRVRRSADVLRDRVGAWCAEHGGTLEELPRYNSVLEAVIGGRWRVPLREGDLIVHLPADDRGQGFSINTCFVGEATLPDDANQHSGKWNFPCYEDAEELFKTFTLSAERLPLKVKPRRKKP